MSRCEEPEHQAAGKLHTVPCLQLQDGSGFNCSDAMACRRRFGAILAAINGSDHSCSLQGEIDLARDPFLILLVGPNRAPADGCKRSR